MGNKKAAPKKEPLFIYFITFRTDVRNCLLLITTSDRQQPGSYRLRYQ